MTEKTEQNQVTKVLAEEDPDAVATLPVTASEQEASTKADAGESIRLAMRMCRDQISRNKHFAHVSPKRPKGAREMSEPATSSEGHEPQDSEQHRLGSHAVQGHPCRHRRPKTRRSRQDDCILKGGRILR